ncbi:MAG: CDP-diacylglycerol--serine O-phosphatidyltransferase [Bacteroidales bacterium]|nr:CDP-diacylglycerol--serine O-phosphatidyltransferase [Bacteroidales bacterium]
MEIKKHIPNFITSLNIVCGTAGIVLVMKERVDLAFLLMLAAAVFDFLDGFAARALGAYSDMGKELDSLCDVVSFGVLPSVMLYHEMRACSFGESFLCWIPLLIAAFSALRLAKFNIDERQASGFLGLPTPACALLVGSLCYYVCYDPACFLAMWLAGPVFGPVLSLCLCALLVCEIPMFSLKFHKDDSQTLKIKRMTFAFIILAAVIVCAVCRLNWSVIVLIVLTCYILKNIVYSLFDIQ